MKLEGLVEKFEVRKNAISMQASSPIIFSMQALEIEKKVVCRFRTPARGYLQTFALGNMGRQNVPTTHMSLCACSTKSKHCFNYKLSNSINLQNKNTIYSFISAL